MGWKTPRTWNPGEVVTPAMLNADVRDQFARIVAPFDSYTVSGAGYNTFSWTASGTNPSIGNGSIIAEWSFPGARMVDLHILITMGSSTTYGSGTWLFQLPVAPNLISQEPINASVMLYDVSAVARRAAMAYVSNAGGSLLALVDTGASASVTASSPFAWAAGDQLAISGRYAAA